jgi:hypothetical protein
MPGIPNPTIPPNFIPEVPIEATHRSSIGPATVSSKDIISGKVDGRPVWHCCHVRTVHDGMFGWKEERCTFEAPFGSRAYEKHLTVHRYKLTAAERKQAEANEAARRAIYPKRILCEMCAKEFAPGESHYCPGVPFDPATLSINQSAKAFQDAGLRQLLQEMKALDED